MDRTTRRTLLGFGAGVAVTGLVAAGVATAAIPSAAGGTFTACVNRSSGAARIIDTAARQRCSSAERLVTWTRNTPRGSWSARATYLAGDLVQHGGSTWQAKLANKGRAPATGRYWTLFAAAGAQGPQGGAGPQGPQGVQGLPGTARAYAHVTRDGSGGYVLDTARSRNVVNVVKPTTGATDRPCVILAAGIDRETATAVGTIDAQETPSWTTAVIGARVGNEVGQGCPAGSLALFLGRTVPSSADNIAFNVIIG